MKDINLFLAQKVEGKSYFTNHKQNMGFRDIISDDNRNLDTDIKQNKNIIKKN